MVRLLTGGPEQHMQSVTDDLCDRTIVRKYEIDHACEIVVQQRPKDIRFDRLDKRGKTSNVAEQRRDFTTLSPEIHRGRIAGERFSKVRREVTRKRRMSSLGLGLSSARFAQNSDMPDSLAIVASRSRKSMGFVRKSNAPQFIAARIFAMSPYVLLGPSARASARPYAAC